MGLEYKYSLVKNDQKNLLSAGDAELSEESGMPYTSRSIVGRYSLFDSPLRIEGLKLEAIAVNIDHR